MMDETGLPRLPLRKRVMFLAAFAFIGLGLAELAARAVDTWTYVSISELRDTYQQRRQWRLGTYWPLQRGDYPYLPYVLNPDHADINDLGFRGAPITREKAPGTYRIVCLGGSTTFNGYPTYLAEALAQDFEAQGLKLEVINAGNQCWTTMDSLINFIARCLPLSPDAVVVYHAVNDSIYSFGDGLSPDYSTLRKRLVKDDPLVWDYLPNALDHSAAFVGFRAVFERKVGQRGIGIEVSRHIPKGAKRDYLGMEPFRQNLLSLASITQKRNISLFLCTQIFNREAEKRHSLFDQWASAVDDANAITRTFTDPANGVHVIDVASALPGNNEWMTDFCHFTEDGKSKVASYIAKNISANMHTLLAQRAQTWPTEVWALKREAHTRRLPANDGRQLVESTKLPAD